MLKPQRKMKKKEIKEDKFVQFTLEAKSYVEENSKRVTMLAGGVFAIIVLIMLYVYLHNNTLIEATTLMGKASVEYQAMNYSTAKVFLETLIEDYSGTDAASQGLFLLGNLYFKEKNISEAKKYFQEFIDSYSDTDILLASGYAGIAACLSSEGNFESAAENYMKAYKATPELLESADYLYFTGINYRKAENYDKARDAFRKVNEEFEDSSRSFDAKEELLLIANK